MSRTVFTVLITITGISSLQVAFFPRLPGAVLPEVNLDDMVLSQARLLEELPGQRSRDWALSPTRRYSLRSIEGRQASFAVSLSLTGVAVRRTEYLQVALVTLGDPSLEMDQRRVYQTTDGDEYAMGKIRGLDALQSCKVPSRRSGVTRKTLEQLTLPQPMDRRDLTGNLRRLAGLRANRSYECVLVTLTSSERGRKVQLINLWRRTLVVLKDQLSDQS